MLRRLSLRDFVIVTELDIELDSGFTALMYAAYFGNADTVAALLKAGADRAVKATNGKTALEIATERGHEAVVALLG